MWPRPPPPQSVYIVPLLLSGYNWARPAFFAPFASLSFLVPRLLPLMAMERGEGDAAAVPPFSHSLPPILTHSGVGKRKEREEDERYKVSFPASSSKEKEEEKSSLFKEGLHVNPYHVGGRRRGGGTGERERGTPDSKGVEQKEEGEEQAIQTPPRIHALHSSR